MTKGRKVAIIFGLCLLLLVIVGCQTQLDYEGADLHGKNLSGDDMSGANLERADLSMTTVLAKLNISAGISSTSKTPLRNRTSSCPIHG